MIIVELEYYGGQNAEMEDDLDKLAEKWGGDRLGGGYSDRGRLRDVQYCGFSDEVDAAAFKDEARNVIRKTMMPDRCKK